MSSYTQDLINILYTGIYHDFSNIYHFIKFMRKNMDYEFSEGVSFDSEDTSFVYYIHGESFFIANVDEEKIVFSPGESFDCISEEPSLVKEALLSFLIFFKNYDTIENIEEIEKDFRKGKSGPKRRRRPKLMAKTSSGKKAEIKFIDEDEESSEPVPEDISESSEDDFDDEWI